MKKFLAFILSFATFFSLTACGGVSEEKEDNLKSTEVETEKTVTEESPYAEFREPIEMYFRARFNADVEAFLDGCIDDGIYMLEDTAKQKEALFEYLPKVQAEMISTLDESNISYNPNNIYGSIINGFKIVGTEESGLGNLRVYVEIDTPYSDWFEENAPMCRNENGDMYLVFYEIDGEHKVIWAPHIDE